MDSITVFITQHQRAEIQAIVVATGLKFAEVLRRLIDEGLKEAETSHWARRRQQTQPQGAPHARGRQD